MVTFSYYGLLFLVIFVAVLLILLILIQKGRGGGLSGAFGGSGGTTAFGAKTGDVLTWATSVVFGVFLVLCVALDLLVNSQYKSVIPIASTPVTPITAPAADITAPMPVLPTPIVPATTMTATPAPATAPAAGMPSFPMNMRNLGSASTAPSVDQLVKRATTQVDKAVHVATQPVMWDGRQ